MTDPTPQSKGDVEFSGWLFLSFVSEETGKFSGAVIIESVDIENAAQRAWELDINPGGQVLSFDIPKAMLPQPEFRNRLLSRAEANTAFRNSGGCVRVGDAIEEASSTTH